MTLYQVCNFLSIFLHQNLCNSMKSLRKDITTVNKDYKSLTLE